MTLPASGPLSLGGSASNSINNEFGYGANLGAYRNKLYTNAAGTTTSAFPFAPNSISIPSGTGYSFYNSRKIPSGTVTFTPGTGTFTIPPYNTLVITVNGAGGGGGGGGGGSGGGGCNGLDGGPGTSGGASSISASGWSGYYAYAGGGGGGGQSNTGTSNGANGTSYNGSNGGAGGGARGGGHAGGNGGNGQVVSATLTNPLLGGSGVSTGVVSNYSVGGGGSQGGGGVGKNANALGQCYNDGGVYGYDGSPGGNGSITISWS